MEERCFRCLAQSGLPPELLVDLNDCPPVDTSRPCPLFHRLTGGAMGTAPEPPTETIDEMEDVRR